MDISVIIPTYNRLWCLPKAVESCRNTHCQTEIIVIDDGSTDGTWEWLQTQTDIISLRQDNWGKGWAVNRGFAIAKGEYVRFLDSDDRCHPRANDRQLEIAREQGADVVVAGYELYSESEKLLIRADWTECDDFVAQQLGECGNSHYSAYLFRRDFIKDIPHRTEFGARDDRQFVIEVAMANPKVAIYSQPALFHYHHDKDRMQYVQGMKMTTTILQHLNIYKKCLAKLAAKGELTPRRRKASCYALWTLAHWIAYTHLDEACEVVEWIYQLNPEFQISQPGLLGKLYTHLGFRNTERLLFLRRNILALFRRASAPKIHNFPI
jgi:glycosyltransferase involved in cell wall biosynthesis